MEYNTLDIVQNKGILYVIATPIGNLTDISLRAINTLKQVDLIAAEDTRHSAYLLKHYNITTPMISLHEHNEAARLELIQKKLLNGLNIALISDAGTPLISDPGYKLVHYLRMNNISVHTIPGACALIAALSIAGLPTDKFIFEGFLPTKSEARKKYLETLITETKTLVFYESPHRILELVINLNSVFGATRQAALARELTKTFETVLTGTLSELEHKLQTDLMQQKGEFVVIVAGKPTINLIPALEIPLDQENILKTLLKYLSIKDAVKIAAELTGLPKNKLYRRALELI